MPRNDDERVAGEKLKTFWQTVKRRIPSAPHMMNAFLACLFPIQLWSIYNLLKEVPAWTMQMSVWDVIGVISYTQIVVLFESIVIFLPLVLLCVFLPKDWFREKFIALSTGIVFLSAVWFIFAHLYEETLRSWSLRQLLPWIGLYFLTQILFFSLIHVNRKLESMIISFVDRLMVLSFVYLFIDVVSVFIVVIRNIPS